MFDNSLEALVIKYTLGSAFIIITIAFVIKMIILFSMVFDMKMNALLDSIRSFDWVKELIKGAVK